MKKFGSSGAAPIPGTGSVQPNMINGNPAIDRTYKFFYGGAQKRPDGQYCRPIKNTDDKVRYWKVILLR